MVLKHFKGLGVLDEWSQEWNACIMSRPVCNTERNLQKIYRRSRNKIQKQSPDEKAVIKNFAIFTGKQLSWALQHRSFPVNIRVFLRTLILKNICEWLLLKIIQSIIVKFSSKGLIKVVASACITIVTSLFDLTRSWQRSLLYRNQCIDWLCKPMDWFLYDRDLRPERVNVSLSRIHFLGLVVVFSRPVG